MSSTRRLLRPFIADFYCGLLLQTFIADFHCRLLLQTFIATFIADFYCGLLLNSKCKRGRSPRPAGRLPNAKRTLRPPQNPRQLQIVSSQVLFSIPKPIITVEPCASSCASRAPPSSQMFRLNSVSNVCGVRISQSHPLPRGRM